MFATGESVKITREEVSNIIRVCTANCTDDAFLRSDYESMWDAFPASTVASVTIESRALPSQAGERRP